MNTTEKPAPPVVHTVPTAKGHVHVTEYAGAGPAVVLTHGYPDDSRIYRRLIAELATRHVVAFDFLGHGKSGREAVWPLTPGQREGELTAVIESLGLVEPILFGHDASGPVVVNYALANPERVGALALVNTYYSSSAMPSNLPPSPRSARGRLSCSLTCRYRTSMSPPVICKLLRCRSR